MIQKLMQLREVAVEEGEDIHLHGEVTLHHESEVELILQDGREEVDFVDQIELAS